MKILKEIKDLKAEIKDAETKDALACTIICTNVSKRTFEFVKGPDTSFKIMEKLKSLYRKKKFSDVQYWMKKIYLLKASTLIVQCKKNIYIFTFIDEFIRKGGIFFLKNKSDIPRTIINIFTYLNNQSIYEKKIFPF